MSAYNLELKVFENIEEIMILLNKSSYYFEKIIYKNIQITEDNYIEINFKNSRIAL